MKMKLSKRVFLFAHENEASGSVIHLDSVAVIDDMQRRGFVVEVDSGQGCLPRNANINGRLVMSKFALRKLRTEVTPMAGTMALAIIPIVSAMLFLRAATHD
jgi:hypothetical protein